MFSLQLSIPTITLLSITFFIVALLLLIYRRRVASVARYASKCDNAENPTELPRASVIVYADIDTEAQQLSAMLNQVLNQEYPVAYEIIVINDGSSHTTRQVVEQLELKHPNLYLSFTPDDTRNLSRKKLSLTIGIKAARNEVVVLTCADTKISSSKWLASMTRHFSTGSDIVIGYADIDPTTDRQYGKRRRAFATANEAMQYLSSAIASKPYRGIGYNIAYRRSVFFDNKGFSRSLNLLQGDDDLFIDEIARRYNTAVELSSDSHISIITDRPRAFYRTMRLNRSFTHRFLKGAPRILFGFCSLLFWLWLAASAATIASDWDNAIVGGAVFLLALALWIPILVAWRHTLRAIHSRRLLFTLPMLIMIQPFSNLIYRIKANSRHNRNYTWQ